MDARYKERAERLIAVAQRMATSAYAGGAKPATIGNEALAEMAAMRRQWRDEDFARLREEKR